MGILPGQHAYLADNGGMVSAAQSRLIQAELAPAALGAQISSAIAAKTLNAQKQEAAAVLQLLDQAAQVAPVPTGGTGAALDVVA